MNCCTKEDLPEGEEHSPQARRNAIVRVILLTFLILNPVWGMTETFTAMVVNFLINHHAGSDGFTNFNSKVRDIVFIEHQEWELPSETQFKEITVERQYMLDLRNEITAKCSKPILEGSNKVIDDQCNQRIPDDNVGIYFCDIVENPDIFHEAYRPLIKLWLVFNLMYLIPCPVMLLGTMWRKQRIHLFTAYTILQILPMLLSLSILISIHGSEKYTLCAISYLYNRFPTKLFFTLLVILRSLLKLFEIVVIYYYIYLAMAEKAKRGFGLKSKNRARVAPLSRQVRVQNEVLQERQLNQGSQMSIMKSESRLSMSLAPSTVVDIFQKPGRQHKKKSGASMKSQKSGRASLEDKKRESLSSEMQLGMSLADFEDDEEDNETNLMTTAETSLESTATDAKTATTANGD